MASGGISGTAVAMVTAGAFLVYVGLSNLTPLDAMRELSKGKLMKPAPKKPANGGAAKSAYQILFSPSDSGGSSTGGGVVPATLGTASGPLPQLVAAAQRHAGEQYSQGRRWDPDFSDCSSFVGKSLKDIGIEPPGASVTTSYLAWSALSKIDRSQVGAGDLIVNTGHIIIAVDNSAGIGQQNSRRNVQVGRIEDLMSGLGFVCLRYNGGAPRSAASMAT
jgi:cell wall-associated NlpC family hydrolase